MRHPAKFASLARLIALVLPGLTITSVASAQQLAAVAAMPQTTATFCSDVQRTLAGTTRVSRNTVHPEFEGFRKSKPQIDPLETHQYVMYADAARTQPMRISCKTKSADHLLAVFGPGSATDDSRSCRDINKQTINAVWAAMPQAERSSAVWPPTKIMLDADDVGFMGSAFVAPYTFLYKGSDGQPHVLARALFASWDNWLWKLGPDRFHGTHYCHLIAPEYARQLMRGAVTLPPQPQD